jgi:hypothetical protein
MQTPQKKPMSQVLQGAELPACIAFLDIALSRLLLPLLLWPLQPSILNSPRTTDP